MENRPLLRWRWDQGRLDYFLYENIVRIARVLARLDGIPLNSHEDLLRKPLEQGVELPFAPNHYKVWRNYARVFACAMLATQENHRLVVTDLCRRLADENRMCARSSERRHRLSLEPGRLLVARNSFP